MIAPPSSSLTEADGVAFADSVANRSGRAFGWVVATIGACVLGFVALLPVARVQGPEVPAATTFFAAGVLAAELATSYLLFVWFRAARTWSLLLLGCAYLYSGLMAVLHLLTFPGAVLAGSSVLGAPQSIAWAFIFWMDGYAILTLAAVVLEIGAADRPLAHGAMGQWMTLAIMVTLAVAGFVALAAIGQVGQLPPLMQGTSWTAANRASSYLSIALLAISIGLILTLIRQKSALFLWLSLALAAVLLANVLSLAGGGRYTVGWFAGRLSWAASAGVLFLFFMAQFAAQQRRLAHARDTLEQRVAERTRALSLEIAERRSVEERQQVARARIEQLQSELLHASRLSTMGQMAGALAHELNQPLTAARNYLAALRRLGQVDTVPRQQLAEVTQRIDAQVVRLGEIIRHLREFVVKGESERRLETINAVIEAAAVLGLVESRHRGVRLSLRLAANVLPVQIDRVQIQQVVVNLVRNAAEAMDGLAVRELTIRTALRPEIRSIEITVSDTGPGIAPEIAPRLFQPFVSTKGSGRGLGLSICREIIAAHGGQLTVAANVPQGAVFSIVLPMAATGGATGASASEV